MQYESTQTVAFLVLTLTFLGTIAGSFLAIRDGRRLPPMSRSSYRRRMLLLCISFFAVILPCMLLMLVPVLQVLFSLPLLVLPVIHYQVMRAGLQRLSDIEGSSYQGFWRAFLSCRPEMIIYLCSKQGRTPPPVDVDAF